MTILLTLLTLFIDPKPKAANVPPEPASVPGEMDIDSSRIISGFRLRGVPNYAQTNRDIPPGAALEVAAMRTTEEVEVTTPAPKFDPLGLPRLTPSAWHASPSWMVAGSSVPTPNTFDVFGPAHRPPQEFPTLFPCPQVAMVPWVPSPSPLPFVEPPAVRHVSLAVEEGFHPLQTVVTAANTHYHEVADCGAPEVAVTLCEHLHARQHATPTCNVSPSKAACDSEGVYCPPAFAPAFHPVGFGPVSIGCPVMAGPGPFPGAKSVQHVVRATYEVPHTTAKALEPILEQSNGVLGCVVDGDELTVNATAPAQTAIAQFLSTVVMQPRTVSTPARTISVNFTKAANCETECNTSKCCEGKCCDGKCECKCGKAKPDTTSQTEAVKGKGQVFSFYTGVADCQTCPTAKGQPIACDVAAHPTRPKTVQILIEADGTNVLVKTSDGTQLRAKRIQLSTQGVNQLQVENGNAILPTSHAQPKPERKPEPSAKKAPEPGQTFSFGGFQITR